MEFSWKSIVRALAKVAGAFALVLAIAAGNVVLGGDASVSTSEADILGTVFEDRPEETFRRALDSLGHEEPRTYRLNGNDIEVSTRHARSSPKQLLTEYQREFARRGLNSEVYVEASPENARDRTRDALTGGVVPQTISDDYIAMSGVSVRGGARTKAELIAAWAPDKNEQEMFRSHRWIEMFRPEGHSRTTVVASWSDDFDYREMIPDRSLAGGEAEREAGPFRPPQGRRINSFADPQADDDFASETWMTSQSVRQVVDHYRRLTRRTDWRSVESSSSMAKISERVDLRAPSDGRLLAFRRGADLRQVHVTPMDDRKTAVHVSKLRSKNPRIEKRSNERNESDGAGSFWELFR